MFPRDSLFLFFDSFACALFNVHLTRSSDASGMGNSRHCYGVRLVRSLLLWHLRLRLHTYVTQEVLSLSLILFFFPLPSSSDPCRSTWCESQPILVSAPAHTVSVNYVTAPPPAQVYSSPAPAPAPAIPPYSPEAYPEYQQPPQPQPPGSLSLYTPTLDLEINVWVWDWALTRAVGATYQPTSFYYST